MVCAKCEKKERDLGLGLAATDVWKPIGKGAGDRSDVGSRVIGENKLLSSKRKMKMQPYMIKDVKATRKRGDDKGEGSSSFAGGAVSSCKKCKSKVAKPGAQYCQGCAYKDGICSQCGVEVLKNKAQYKMSSK